MQAKTFFTMLQEGDRQENHAKCIFLKELTIVALAGNTDQKGYESIYREFDKKAMFYEDQQTHIPKRTNAMKVNWKRGAEIMFQTFALKKKVERPYGRG